ncbi:hypothetical protein NON00_13000 [Roseomonas sp. GC11]|uniref:hypothetical protein n=1 Tax=Roseomonas sp. GC11 TaxID=2950546 RepID=UPI00210994F1|nr:hypothetical protein [Roseomonas sp. GC11]MCQ4160846.1 hypothetical protein [Roseomonas sp. GC11]
MVPDEIPDITAETVRQLRKAGVSLTVGDGTSHASFSTEDGRLLDLLRTEGMSVADVVRVGHALRRAYAQGRLDVETERGPEWAEGACLLR